MPDRSAAPPAAPPVPPSSGSIVLWGPPGSGKSTYLATLVFHAAALDEQARRWCVLPADAVTAEWVLERVGRWREGAPSPKSLVPEPQPLAFHLYSLPPARAGFFARKETRAAAQVETTLRFWDVPGEAYTGEPPEAVLQEMARARGILLVLDPGHEPPEGRERFYERFFLRTLGRLGFAARARAEAGEPVDGLLAPDNRLTVPVAICLSHLDEHPALREGDRVRFLRERFGDGVQLLEKWLTTWEVIPMSATGGAAAAGRPDPAPELAVQPLAWLLDQTRAGAGAGGVASGPAAAGGW